MSHEPQQRIISEGDSASRAVAFQNLLDARDRVFGLIPANSLQRETVYDNLRISWRNESNESHDRWGLTFSDNTHTIVVFHTDKGTIIRYTDQEIAWGGRIHLISSAAHFVLGVTNQNGDSTQADGVEMDPGLSERICSTLHEAEMLLTGVTRRPTQPVIVEEPEPLEGQTQRIMDLQVCLDVLAVIQKNPDRYTNAALTELFAGIHTQSETQQALLFLYEHGVLSLREGIWHMSTAQIALGYDESPSREDDVLGNIRDMLFPALPIPNVGMASHIPIRARNTPLVRTASFYPLDGAGQRYFEDLVAQFQTSLERFVFRFFHNPEDTQDVVQDVFINAYQAIAAGRTPRPDALSKWLHEIAKNAAISALRKKVHSAIPFSLFHGDIGAPLYDGERFESRIADREIIEKVFDRLPSLYALPLLLLCYQGFSEHEIAEVLDITYTTVKTRIFRARKLFTALYEQELRS